MSVEGLKYIRGKWVEEDIAIIHKLKNIENILYKKIFFCYYISNI